MDPAVVAASRSRREFGVLARALRSAATCPPLCVHSRLRAVRAPRGASRQRQRSPDHICHTAIRYAAGPQPIRATSPALGGLGPGGGPGPRCRLRSHSEEAGWRCAEQISCRPLGGCIGQWKDSPAPWRGYRAVELECACWRVAWRELNARRGQGGAEACFAVRRR
jgi:hypothetical protein